MVALTDALRAYAPPNKAVAIDWPDAVRIDGAVVGGGRMGWPSSASEDAPPRLACVRRHDPDGRDDEIRSRAFIRLPRRWTRRTLARLAPCR